MTARVALPPPSVACPAGVGEQVRQQRTVERFQAWWSRAQPALRLVVTVALLTAGLLLVIDALW